MANQDYNRDGSIDLNLNESEILSLSILLKEATKNARDYHEDSHLGVCVRLCARIQFARLGSKNWNRGR